MIEGLLTTTKLKMAEYATADEARYCALLTDLIVQVAYHQLTYYNNERHVVTYYSYFACIVPYLL